MNKKCFKCTFDCLAELKKKYRRWKFVRMWNKKNKNWRECRHKRKRRAEAVRKVGIKW